jgi:hypothetical protein
MLRDAKRPLAGPVKSYGEPELILGHYTRDEYSQPYGRTDLAGAPAVSVNLNGGRSGTRTFVDPAELRDLANELVAAACWLADIQIQQKEGGQ